MALSQNLSLKTVLKVMNFWPPYLGAGIKVALIDETKMIVEVSMKLKKLNSNYVGVHFGGSLYSMVDPFYMLILMKKLGGSYIVWDKAASIEFKSPGRGRVSCHFEISPEQVEKVIREVEEKGKCEPCFDALIYGEEGELVARVEKKLWVRKK